MVVPIWKSLRKPPSTPLANLPHQLSSSRPSLLAQRLEQSIECRSFSSNAKLRACNCLRMTTMNLLSGRFPPFAVYSPMYARRMRSITLALIDRIAGYEATIPISRSVAAIFLAASAQEALLGLSISENTPLIACDMFLVHV